MPADAEIGQGERANDEGMILCNFAQRSHVYTKKLVFSQAQKKCVGARRSPRMFDHVTIHPNVLPTGSCVAGRRLSLSQQCCIRRAKSLEGTETTLIYVLDPFHSA